MSKITNVVSHFMWIKTNKAKVIDLLMEVAKKNIMQPSRKKNEWEYKKCGLAAALAMIVRAITAPCRFCLVRRFYVGADASGTRPTFLPELRCNFCSMAVVRRLPALRPRQSPEDRWRSGTMHFFNFHHSIEHSGSQFSAHYFHSGCNFFRFQTIGQRKIPSENEIK